MRFALAAAFIGGIGSAAAQSLNFIDRNYYAYGYADGVTEGVPNG
jgi:hypothetical protein